jgi:acyl-CoA synthetase (AMP-forming)/AMP-acid ligase II
LNLTQLFDLSFEARRDHPALEFQGAAYTFGDIDARSNRLAQLLAHRGFKMGDRLCVYLANCLEMIDLYLACVKLGVIFVPINILYRERELTHILADAEPAAVVSATPLPGPVPVWDPADLTREATAFSNQRPAVTLDGDTPAGQAASGKLAFLDLRWIPAEVRAAVYANFVYCILFLGGPSRAFIYFQF